MVRNIQKKMVGSVRRKTQMSTAKNRRSVQRPKKTMATQENQAKIVPVMINKKRSVVITPMTQAEKQGQMRAQEQQEQMQEQMQMQKQEQMQMQKNMNARQVINVSSVRERMQTQKTNMMDMPVRTAKQIKEDAIEKAMQASVSQPQVRKKHHNQRINFGFKRVALALACAAAAVFAIVYFVNLNKPDISLKVAAIQNGIDAIYPKYIPRGYDLSDITSESGRITLSFKNPTSGDSFVISEEKSAWDSNALFTNYVKPNYSSNYTTIKEQGLTIYIDGSNACWTNGGIVFKLIVKTGSLTKKQITTIATTR
jgi:hypothetical protein